jgi:two-component system KDP operon response regulator KdpE
MVAAPHGLVLVVDDDPAILKLVRLELTEQEFRVVAAERGADALRLAGLHQPDLIVLDVMLPDISGLEVMRRLRESSQVPVILISAKGGDADKVGGLELGADDYVAKPFNPEELGARVRAVLRREQRQVGPTESVVRVGDLVIDLERRVVTQGDTLVPLTRTEWNLLRHLAANAGKVMVSAEILTQVWGPEYRDDVQYLRVWISRLRSKLEPGRPERSLIRTFSGVGYMFDPTVDATVEAAERVGRDERRPHSSSRLNA